MNYKYYISYVYTRGNISSVGWGESNASRKITGHKDLEELSDILCKNGGYDEVVILNYKLLTSESIGCGNCNGSNLSSITNWSYCPWCGGFLNEKETER